MKIRYDFVTNSSSTSYLIAVKEKNLNVSESIIFKNLINLIDHDDTEEGIKLKDTDSLRYYLDIMEDKEKRRFNVEMIDDSWSYYKKELAYDSSGDMLTVFKSFNEDKLKIFKLYS